jgi:hypothetical protein
MQILTLIIEPECTGNLNEDSVIACPIACALREYGFTKVIVSEDEWKGMKWWVIPIGGRIPYRSKEISNECARTKQVNERKIKLELRYFYNNKNN